MRIILLLLSLISEVCRSDSTLYYTSYHYEFDYNDLTHNADNNKTLISDNHAHITIINASLLSFIINTRPFTLFETNTNADIALRRRLVGTATNKALNPQKTEYSIPKLDANKMSKLHNPSHRKAFKGHIHRIKEAILHKMYDSFKENNEKNQLLQQINDLKEQQSELDLKHKIFQIKKDERKQLNAERDKVIKQRMKYETQSRTDRQKLYGMKQKMIKERHDLRVKEHKTLMNGLKSFIDSWSALVQEQRRRERERQRQMDRYYQSHRKVFLPLPMPPMPNGMVTEVRYGRRLIAMSEGIGFGMFEKCASVDFGKVCVSYSDESGIIGFDIMHLEQRSVSGYVSERNVYGFVGYEYRVGSDGIERCVAGNDNNGLVLDMCLDGNGGLVVYFDARNDKGLLMGDMSGYERGVFEWMEDTQWNEIVTFEKEGRVMKCVELNALLGLCVSKDENQLFVVEYKMALLLN